jgi:hypothetical protein
MRSRVLAPVLIAGLVALALPGPSEARGANRGRVGHPSGGGHYRSVGHPGYVGRGGPGGHPGRNPHVVPFRGAGRFGWHGYRGRGGLYLGLPLWWDAYWGWGWPYGYYGYNGLYGYYGYYGDNGYPDSGVVLVPSNPGEAESGIAGTESETSGGATAAVSGTSPVELQVSPASALVFLNGVPVGSVDEFGGGSDYLYLDAGRYAVEFRAPGFRTRTLWLSVSGGNKTLVSLDLQADPAASAERTGSPSPGLPHGRRFSPSFGPAASQPGPQESTAGEPGSTALVLHVSPSGAAVYVDGVLLGTGEHLAQLKEGLAVSPGPHRIDVVAPGHTGKTLQVDAQAGKKLELSVTLD